MGRIQMVTALVMAASLDMAGTAHGAVITAPLEGSVKASDISSDLVWTSDEHIEVAQFYRVHADNDEPILDYAANVLNIQEFEDRSMVITLDGIGRERINRCGYDFQFDFGHSAAHWLKTFGEECAKEVEEIKDAVGTPPGIEIPEGPDEQPTTPTYPTHPPEQPAAPVPEPATMGTLGFGLMFVASKVRRWRK